MAYVAEFTSDLRHMAGADNVVVDCISRPPEELYLPRSTQVASLKAPSGSLAAPVVRDGSSGASTAAAAVVPATQQGPIRWVELAREQLTCQETQDVLTSNTGLLLEMVAYQGANLWCDTSTGASGPLCQPPKGGQCLSTSMGFHTLGGGPCNGWWPPALSGLA